MLTESATIYEETTEAVIISIMMKLHFLYRADLKYETERYYMILDYTLLDMADQIP